MTAVSEITASSNQTSHLHLIFTEPTVPDLTVEVLPLRFLSLTHKDLEDHCLSSYFQVVQTVCCVMYSFWAIEKVFAWRPDATVYSITLWTFPTIGLPHRGASFHQTYWKEIDETEIVRDGILQYQDLYRRKKYIMKSIFNLLFI